ncbi:hypothetical protein [Streptomyces erythrochromogenes]|uniref:hypothetical protein n=1 Tax=Streptomyces erythrochromogenes TaxID=285574 RepID=UPI00131C9F71|nr:hypothetical protein [Streptomyces erythrochromogenes]
MGKSNIPDRLGSEAVGPILSEHYPRLVRAPDASRSRAQNAFAIASAAAGSVTAALLVTQSNQLDPVGVFLVAGALAAWFLASAIYISAVAIPLRHAPKTQAADALAARVLKDAWDDHVFVDRLTLTANCVAMIALCLTVAGFLTMVMREPSTVPGKILLAPSLSKELANQCKGVAPESLSGSIERRSLQLKWLVVHTNSETCPRNIVLRLPQSQIYGVEADIP